MNPECKRCLKKGSACWQHDQSIQEEKKRAKNKYGPWDEIPGKCNGKKLGGDGLCRQPAGWGTDHTGIGCCKRHGGATKNYSKHAQKIKAEQSLAAYGHPVDIEPHEALFGLLHAAVGDLIWIAERIRGVDPDALEFGPRRIKTSEILQRNGDWKQHPLRQIESSIAPSIWIQQYNEKADLVRKLSKDIIACGIAERQVRIHEEMASQIAGGYRHFAELLGKAFGFDPNAEEVRGAMGESLRLLGGVEETA